MVAQVQSARGQGKAADHGVGGNSQEEDVVTPTGENPECDNAYG